MRFKRALAFLFFAGIVFPAISQTSEAPVEKRRPDIPGTFVVELGVNRGIGAPDNLSLGLWGSRTVNIYYQYDIRILKSRFSFVPGIGVSLERFKLKNSRTLGYVAGDSLKFVLPGQLDPPITGVRKSQLITNYVEVPLEIKYQSQPEDPARTFKISVGARIGYMYDSFTKLKYKDGNDIFKVKNKQSWDLNRFRYGTFMKVGIGNFSIFGYMNMTELFQKDKAPYQQSVNETTKITTHRRENFPTFTVGISLSSF